MSAQPAPPRLPPGWVVQWCVASECASNTAGTLTPTGRCTSSQPPAARAGIRQWRRSRGLRPAALATRTQASRRACRCRLSRAQRRPPARAPLASAPACPTAARPVCRSDSVCQVAPLRSVPARCVRCVQGAHRCARCVHHLVLQPQAPPRARPARRRRPDSRSPRPSPCPRARRRALRLAACRGDVPTRARTSPPTA